MKRILIFIYLLFCISILNSQNVYQLDFGTEAAIIAPSLLLGGYSFFSVKNQGELSLETIENLNINDINFIDRSATRHYSPTAAKVSDYLLYACLLSPFALQLENSVSEYKEVNLIITETYLMTFALMSFSKTTVKRIRPYAYNENVDISIKQSQEAQYSFFSGHTALAFAGAILTAKMYDDFYPERDNFWVYATATATASTVGYLRYRAGKHFFSDILTGAVVGTGAALLVTSVHKTEREGNVQMIRIGFMF